jgi:hypothetical protein
MRQKLLTTVAAAILVIAGAALLVLRLSGSAGPGHQAVAATSPTAGPSETAAGGPPAAVSTPTPSPTPTATVADACTASQLDMVVGAATSASGGQDGITALVGNHGASACVLAGTITVQLLSGGGAQLPTTQGAEPAGQAWLVPDRVALDPWAPQPGEATVLISWRTGDTAPAVCSGSAPLVGELSLAVPGGGRLAAPVDAQPLVPGGMAPCLGAIQVGAITQVSRAATFTADALAAADAEVEEQEGETVTPGCTPTSGVACLTLSGTTGGTDAAYFEYQSYGTGGGAACFAYVYRDSSGWHPLDTVCGQDLAPSSGGTVAITVPGGGCAAVHSAPGHASSVLTCVSSGTGTAYAVDGAPVYVAETDATSRLAMGTIWWYLPGPGGWVAQDFVAAPGG